MTKMTRCTHTTVNLMIAIFFSDLEDPQASWLLPLAVHRHQGPILQARSGGITGSCVQQQRHRATRRLQTYGEVTATHCVNTHSHLMRNRWQDMRGVNKEWALEGKRRRRNGETKSSCLLLVHNFSSDLSDYTNQMCDKRDNKLHKNNKYSLSV